MARFVYRLQKVHDLRERKKKEQEQRVQEAYARVLEVERAIEAKKQEILQTRQDMQSADHMLLSHYDNFLHRLGHELEELYEDLAAAKQKLAEEKEKLVKAQSDFEAMVKHKEKSLEEWREEQKQRELKMMDEIASQRFFRATAERHEELLEEAERLGISPEEIDS